LNKKHFCDAYFYRGQNSSRRCWWWPNANLLCC